MFQRKFSDCQPIATKKLTKKIKLLMILKLFEIIKRFKLVNLKFCK